MSERDDTAQSLWPLMDLVTPMALRVAATVNVADLLADGPLDAATLAERSGTDADALARVLSHLAGRGVFVEPTPGMFALNPTAEQRRSDSPTGMRLWLDLEGFGGRMDLAFTELLHTVRTGEPSWQRVFGQPFWEYLADHPAVGAAFDETMASGREFVLDAARGYAWPSTAHVVDVGGGTGALLATVLDDNPDVRATLVTCRKPWNAAGSTSPNAAWTRGARSPGRLSSIHYPPAGITTCSAASCTTGPTRRPWRSSAAAPTPPEPPAG